MSYRIHFDECDGIVEIKFSGKWTKDNVDTLTTNMVELPGRATSRVLIDISDIEGQLAIADAFNSVVRFPPEQRSRKTALLDREENIRVVSFFEMTAQNRGIPLRWFRTREEALVWLRG